MASAATTRGAACPRRVSVDKTWHDWIKMFLWAQQDTNCGLDPRGLGLAATGGHESEAGQRAWGSGNPGTREPAGGLGISPAIGGHEGSRPADSLAARDKTQEQIKTRKNKQNKTRWRVPLTVRSGLLPRCTHEEDAGTRRRGRKLNNSL